MKITAIFVFAAIMQVQASGYAQNITLTLKNAPLQKAFAEIGKQSGYQFFFNERLLKNARLVSLELQDATIEEALDVCFKDQSFGFAIVEKTVVIKPKVANPDVENPEDFLPPPPVSGKVVGPDGMPLAGVSVTVKGSKKGTATDNNGNYTLNLDEDEKILVFSFVGMKRVEVPVNGRTAINITMEAEVSKQDEVVVIGYGTSKVIDMTGSVSRVTAEDLEGAPPHADLGAMLQGKAAGVNVMISNAAPGAHVALQIRGTTSLTGNNQPLWVIDGIPQYNVNGNDIATVLYDFNITDVESIDILKDASATAIYGSRAANGVVLVTTKKGTRNMRPQVDFSYNVGVQKQRDQFRMLNTEEFKQVITSSARNYFSAVGTVPTSGGIYLIMDPTKVVTGGEVDYYSAPIRPDLFHNGQTNWWNELSQSAIESKYDVSIRGGNQQSTFYVSFGHVDQQGILKGSDRKGYIGRFNFETQVGSIFKMGMNVNGSFTAINNQDNMVDRIWNFRPDYPMYDDAGKPFDPGYNEENPLTTLKNRNLQKRKGLNASGFLEIKPISGLVFKSSFSINYNQGITDRFSREGTVYTNHQGQANMTFTESSNWMFENTATFTKQIKRHNLVGVAGFIMEQGISTSTGTGVQNFPDQDVMTNLSSGTTPMKPSSTYTSSALASAITRLNYKFSDRYLATFTFRADGSSRFGPDRRWGFFPSGALAWVVSKERFMMDNVPVISYLKLRTSFGKSGSQVLGNHDWRTLYTAAPYDESPGMTPSALGNNELQWETTISLDGGIDWGLFSDRLRGTIGGYNKLTRDIIYTRTIPASSAFTSVKQNVATIRNQGVEFDINYDLIKNKDMTLTLNFNIAHNMAKALKINGVDKELAITAGTSGTMRIKEGEPLNQWIGWKWSGRFYQSMEEYLLLTLDSATNPTGTTKVWYLNNTTRPGDLHYLDMNGDGVVNTNDRVPLGSAQPKFFGGFSPSFRYKSFSINTTFSYSYGALRYWYTNSQNWYGLGLFLKNYPAYVLDSWTPDNREALWPRMAYGQGSSNTFSDFWLSRADYLRLNLVRLNYRVPQKLVNIKMIKSIDLSFSASNLFTLTNYNGIDPQGNFRLTTGGVTGTGADYGTYPSAKTFNFSAKISLN